MHLMIDFMVPLMVIDGGLDIRLDGALGGGL